MLDSMSVNTAGFNSPPIYQRQMMKSADIILDTVQPLSGTQRSKYFQYALYSPCLLSTVHLKMTNSYWHINILTIQYCYGFFSTITAVKKLPSTRYTVYKMILIKFLFQCHTAVANSKFLFRAKYRTFNWPFSHVIRGEAFPPETDQGRSRTVQQGCAKVSLTHPSVYQTTNMRDMTDSQRRVRWERGEGLNINGCPL